MAGLTKIQDVTIDEIELEACEIEELDRLAEETRKCGISWEDLKAELGLVLECMPNKPLSAPSGRYGHRYLSLPALNRL